jgi:hypothetical protein
VLEPLEQSFAIAHLVRLDGLEASGVQKLDPKAIRAAYLEELGRHNGLLMQQARALSADFVQLDTKKSLEAALSTYLSARMARARTGS